jgi:cobalt/nickel transport system permease protein
MTDRISKVFYDIGHLEILAEQDSFVHRLDPRAKLLVTVFFILAVVSFDRYAVAGLLPFFLYPALIIGLAKLPAGFLFRKLLIVAPFLLCIIIFNPLLDRETMVNLGPLAISGGWISFISLLLRFTLTVGAALLLIATTGFPKVCMALEKLGTPRILTVQLLLLYRYLFVLIEETIRMIRAHALRSFSHRGPRFKVFVQLLGTLLLRTLDRAERIHLAMLSRAFTGEIKTVRRFTFGRAELLFLLTAAGAFLLFRTIPVAELLGDLLLEISL